MKEREEKLGEAKVESPEHGKGISRRGFLSGAALGAVSLGLLGGCAPKDMVQTGQETAPTAAEGEVVQTLENPAKWSFEIPPEPVADSDIAETFTADVIVRSPLAAVDPIRPSGRSTRRRWASNTIRTLPR